MHLTNQRMAAAMADKELLADQARTLLEDQAKQESHMRTVIRSVAALAMISAANAAAKNVVLSGSNALAMTEGQFDASFTPAANVMDGVKIQAVAHATDSVAWWPRSRTEPFGTIEIVTWLPAGATISIRTICGAHAKRVWRRLLHRRDRRPVDQPDMPYSVHRATRAAIN